MGILLFMGMAINPLTLITSYYIISPWFVWIPMNQPDMRGSIDLTFFSTGMKWSENHPHNIHNQTWYNMTTVMFFFLPILRPRFSERTLPWPENPLILWDKFGWRCQPWMNDKFIASWQRHFSTAGTQCQEVSHREAMRLEPHWLIDMI